MSCSNVSLGRRAAESRNRSFAPLTAAEIALVQQSLASLEPHADAAAELFYTRLFELDPRLRLLFAADMKGQGRKLMTVIRIAVAGLDQLATLLPIVESLGRRHIGYGVRERDYHTVGEALIWALGRGLGAAFTDEVEAAWVKVYGTLAVIMRSAAGQEAA